MTQRLASEDFLSKCCEKKRLSNRSGAGRAAPRGTGGAGRRGGAPPEGRRLGGSRVRQRGGGAKSQGATRLRLELRGAGGYASAVGERRPSDTYFCKFSFCFLRDIE